MNFGAQEVQRKILVLEPARMMHTLRMPGRAQQLHQLDTLLAISVRSSGRSASGAHCSTSYATSACTVQVVEEEHRCLTVVVGFCCHGTKGITVCDFVLITSRWFSNAYFWPAAAGLAVAGCIDTARTEDVDTIHPEAKVWHWITSGERKCTWLVAERYKLP